MQTRYHRRIVTQKKTKSRVIYDKKLLIENFFSLTTALLLVFTVRSSLVEAFRIPSGSMIPTLLVGDHIFVNKFAYGLKLPFSDLFRKRPVYLIQRDPPSRGDIVVFLYPKDESIYYIKRVIGIAGDQIELKNKTLYINQKKVEQTGLSSETMHAKFQALNDPKYQETSFELHSEHMDRVDHLIMLDKTHFLGETFGPITVPEGQLFVMGDNRDMSNDSRFWGFVPLDNVKGKAMFVWLSFWVSFSESEFTFKPQRIGTILH
jgi:signal peptidase I